MDAPVAGVRSAIDLNSERPLRVGRTQIDPLSREASFEGGSERLQPQNLKVLIALARNRGRLVTREALVDLCWDGRFIGDDVINRAISTLRQFAERAGGFAIETVPRAGYRLVETRRISKRGLWMIAAAVAVLVVVAVTTALIGLGRSQADASAPTIALLPFTSASADPQERELASNARDAVAHSLSRTEFRVRLPDGASQLASGAADFIVSGDVTGSPEKMVVTVRIEDTAHNAVVYSNRFETGRASAGNLPDQIGAQIAGSLGWTASVLMLEKNHPSDPAITAELFRNSLNYETARQVADRAPNSVIAQVGLAFSAPNAIPGLPLDQRSEAAAIGRHALARARILAPGFGATEMAWCLLHSRARMIECENHLRAGLRRDPFSPGLANSLASELKDVGRTNEALQIAMNSLAHDPYDPDYIGMALRMGEATGSPNDADDLYRDARRGWPDADVIFWDRVYGILDRGDFAHLEDFQKELSSENRIQALKPTMRLITAINDSDAAAVRRECPSTELPGLKADVCMLALARIDDEDDAFTLAWRIYPNRIGQTVAEEDKLWLESGRFSDSDILMGPAAARLREDPRYLELVRRLGVLAYWRSGRLPDFCRTPHPEVVCRSIEPSHPSRPIPATLKH